MDEYHNLNHAIAMVIQQRAQQMVDVSYVTIRIDTRLSYEDFRFTRTAYTILLVIIVNVVLQAIKVMLAVVHHKIVNTSHQFPSEVSVSVQFIHICSIQRLMFE